MSCPSWQWHRTGSRWSPVRTLLVAPLWCDLGSVPNSRGNKAAANLRPTNRGGPTGHSGWSPEMPWPAERLRQQTPQFTEDDSRVRVGGRYCDCSVTIVTVSRPCGSSKFNMEVCLPLRLGITAFARYSSTQSRPGAERSMELENLKGRPGRRTSSGR